MQQHLALPESFYESLHDDGSGSTRAEQAGEALVAVLHDVLYDFDFDASQVSTVSLCVERRLLVSARAKPLRSIDRLRESVRDGCAFRSPVELLADLLRDQADVMVRTLRDSTSRVNSVEDSRGSWNTVPRARPGRHTKDQGVQRRAPTTTACGMAIRADVRAPLNSPPSPGREPAFAWSRLASKTALKARPEGRERPTAPGSCADRVPGAGTVAGLWMGVTRPAKSGQPRPRV